MLFILTSIDIYQLKTFIILHLLVQKYFDRYRYQFVLDFVKLFQSWSQVIFYLINLHIQHGEKYFSTILKADTTVKCKNLGKTFFKIKDQTKIRWQQRAIALKCNMRLAQKLILQNCRQNCSQNQSQNQHKTFSKLTENQLVDLQL